MAQIGSSDAEPNSSVNANPGGDALAQPREDSLAESVGQLWQALRQALDRAIELVALEARLAAISLAGIMGLGIFIGITLVSSWLLLAAAGAVWLVEQTGLGWALALLLVALLNLVLTALAWFGIRSLSRNLQFRFTRRQLTRGQGISQNASDDPSKA